MSEFLWYPVERTVNGSLLRIVDPGPLRAPIISFVLRRRKDFDLVMETTTAGDAVSRRRIRRARFAGTTTGSTGKTASALTRSARASSPSASRPPTIIVAA